MKKNYQKLSIAAHKKHRGKLTVESTFPLKNREDLSIAYTPGVAGPALLISKNKKAAYDFTTTKNSVAIISDGSAVLGLGNIGPEAALPIMEGKAVLFKKFAGINGFPIVLGTQNTEEIIAAVKAIAPTFGGINLEDISAPRCFEIEERLKKELDIPVMHDDQHGTAIVVLAGLINALKVVKKDLAKCRVVVNGVGAAGVATLRLLKMYEAKAHFTAVDSVGIVSSDRNDLSEVKRRLITDQVIEGKVSGNLSQALIGADIFIGVSKPGTLTANLISQMNPHPIIFALANPTPEIFPSDALKAGAAVVATGRSDYPNQINNVLAYPGIFKGVIDHRIPEITTEMKLSAARALAAIVKKPSAEKIIPGPFEKHLASKVARAVARAYKK